MHNRIAAERDLQEMNQEVLAEKVGMSRQHLSEIENEKAQPGGLIMLKIAAALGKRVEDLFFE